MPITGMNSRRSAILGGSFDPIHVGHLFLMHEAYRLCGIERIILVPANISNFKQGKPPVSFERRFLMAGLAVEDYRELYPEDDLEIIVSPIEGERRGVSYSSDTVRELIPEYGVDGRISFIIGDDIPETLPLWHDWPYLREHVDYLCFRREGGAPCPDDGAHVSYIESDILESSSSSVRSGDHSGLSKRVRRYVEDEKLY